MITKAIIEIPCGSSYKYEIKKNELHLDRVLNIDTPYNYGFIPHTIQDDGDPLDIIVISSVPIYPTTRVKAKVVGVLKCIDNGEQDDKIIAYLEGDINPLEEDCTHDIEEAKLYLENYKTGFKVYNFLGESEALKLIKDSVVWGPNMVNPLE